MAAIAFAGTPAFAVPCLQALAQAGHDLGPVFTQPDRPAGRGRRVQQSPVKSCALELGLNVMQPAKLQSELFDELGTAPDLMVVVAYGLLIPEWLLRWPRSGCLNVHASLLPRWRGAAPIQRAILAGDSVTGVSLMAMTKGLDTGPIYATAAVRISNQNSAQLHDELSARGADLLLEHVAGILASEQQPEPQPSGATYAHKLTKQEASMDWQQSALVLERQVRGMNPWPIAETRWGEQRLRIHSACTQSIQPGSAVAGQVIAATAAGIDVATGDGVLRLEVLQLPGGRPLSAGAFLNAHPVLGDRFG
jgi:methionyl-tRNA formyltransferase